MDASRRRFKDRQHDLRGEGLIRSSSFVLRVLDFLLKDDGARLALVEPAGGQNRTPADARDQSTSLTRSKRSPASAMPD